VLFLGNLGDFLPGSPSLTLFTFIYGRPILKELAGPKGQHQLYLKLQLRSIGYDARDHEVFGLFKSRPYPLSGK
jgi:hypothetical protein